MPKGLSAFMSSLISKVILHHFEREGTKNDTWHDISKIYWVRYVLVDLLLRGRGMRSTEWPLIVTVLVMKMDWWFSPQSCGCDEQQTFTDSLTWPPCEDLRTQYSPFLGLQRFTFLGGKKRVETISTFIHWKKISWPVFNNFEMRDTVNLRKLFRLN